MLWKEDWRVVEWIKLTFNKWKLTDIDISDETENKEEIITKIKEMIFNSNEANLFTGEVAFWTTPHVKPWSILHPLVAEKAFWMHIALWNSYKYTWMDNGNKWADYHWDIIWSMKGNSVTLNMKEWEPKEIMNDGNFNSEIVPKLAKYKKDVDDSPLNS